MSEAIWPLYNTLKLYFCIRSTKDKSIAFLACINALAKGFAYFFCFDPVYKKKIYLLTLPLHILQFLAGTPQQHNANYCGPNNRYLTNNDN
jgi:hypothetical protein